MLATSKHVLFPGHNHLLTSGTDDSSLAGARGIIKVSVHQYQWLAGGYDLEIKTFLKVASIVVTWWIVAFLHRSRGHLVMSEIEKAAASVSSHLFPIPSKISSPVGRSLSRGSLGSTGMKSLSHVISGSGFPIAAHSITVLRSFSTAFSVGLSVMLG